MPSMSSQLMILGFLVLIAPGLEQWLRNPDGHWMRPFLLWGACIAMAWLAWFRARREER